MTPGLVSVGFIHPGEYKACFANSLIDLLFFDAFHEGRIVSHVHGRIGNETGSGQLVSGRNQTVAAFLDLSEAEWLFMIDADMGFASDTVERLLASADPATRPVVGGLAFACKSDGAGEFNARRYRATPTVYRMHETETEVGFVPIFDYPRNALVEVAATGAACLLVHRSVLEQIRATYGDRWFDLIEVPKGPKGRTIFGEDMSFCLRIAAAGFPMFVDTSVRTTHDKGAAFLDEEFYDLQQAALGGRLVAAPVIDVVIPTFGRSDRLAEVAFDVINNSRNVARVMFVVEEDDTASIEAVWSIPSPLVSLHCNDGERTYAGAINSAAKVVTAPWMFTGADDLHFHRGWDESALRLAAATGAKVIGTNDLGHPAVLAGKHSTHSLVSMDYVRQVGATADATPGVVLFNYHHNFVDTELCAVAMHRGVYAHAHASRVEHMHPVWGKAQGDATYDAGASQFDADAETFRWRMAGNIQ